METAPLLLRPALLSGRGGNAQRRLGLFSAGLGATGLAVWAAASAGTMGWARPDERFTIVVTLVSPFVLVGCGLLLWWWRPTNRSGQVMVTLGGLVSAWLLSLWTS